MSGSTFSTKRHLFFILKKKLQEIIPSKIKKINKIFSEKDVFIVLCENLYISEINTAGIPDHKKRTLILDINFNDKSFEYAECSTCSDRLGLDLYNKTNGFLTEYSKSIASEDMAEVYSFLITNKIKITNIANKDSILFDKIEFIKNGIRKIKNIKL